jgi:hypothetical protein
MRNSLILSAVPFLLVSLLPAGEEPALPPAGGPGADSICVDVSVYRVNGDIGGEMSLTEDIEAGMGEAVRKRNVSFFTVPKLTLAGVKLEAGPKGWTWDGKDRPPAGGRVEELASPRVAVAPSQSFQILIGSDRPIQYFERRPDGLFELKEKSFKETATQPGLFLSGRIEKGDPGLLVLRDLTLELRTVEKRKPIEGIALDVGEPLLTVRKEVVTMAVKPGKEYGILFMGENLGGILLQVKADLVK